MRLLFVVEQAVFLKGVGLVLTPGASEELAVGSPLFLVRPDGTHITTTVRPLPKKGTGHSVAVDLLEDEAPEGTRVFGRDPSSAH